MKKKNNLGSYRIKNGHIDICDKEMNLNIKVPFHPKKVPKGRFQDGKDVGHGCLLKVEIDDRLRVAECHIEKDGMHHGQSLLYHPNGTIKSESFYEDGLLHGPATFWSDSGTILAMYWYIHGLLQGKALEYTPSGILYRIQRFRDGLLEGHQEYFDPDGGLRSSLKYSKGRFQTARRA